MIWSWWDWGFYIAGFVGAGIVLSVILMAIISGIAFKRSVEGITKNSMLRAVVKLDGGKEPDGHVVRGRFGWRYGSVGYSHPWLWTFIRIGSLWVRVPNFTSARYLLTIAGLSTKP